MNGTIAFIIALILTLSVFIAVPYLIKKDIDHERSFIGRTIVLKSDTLLIIDSSDLTGSYTLSNGLSIDSEYAQTLILEK